MSLSTEQKGGIVEQYRRNTKDTGSPEVQIALLSARINDRDAIVFVGVEPNMRWRTYAGSILQVCADFDVSLLVTLGAFLADVPHTRPAPVNAASEDADWLAKPGVVAARYEGPTGIVGVLNAAAARANLPAVSLWAAAPHYLPQSRNPKVALALLEALRDLTGLEVDTGEIELAARVFEREVSEAIEEDGNLAAYVSRLEEASEIMGDDGECGRQDGGVGVLHEERGRHDQRNDRHLHGDIRDQLTAAHIVDARLCCR